MREGAIVGVLLLIMFTSAADLLVMTPILPTMAEDLGVGADLGGLWVTAYAVSTGLFALGFGPISDRFGRRSVLRVGILTLGLGTFACGLADGFFALLFARFVAGAGAGMLVTSTTSYAGDHFEPARRAVVVGWVMSGFFLALILAVPIGAGLAASFGWHRMFFVLSGFAACVAVGVFALPVPRSEERVTRLSAAEAGRAYGALLATKPVLGVLLMSFAVSNN